MTIQFSKANGKLAKIAPYAGVKKAHIVSFDLLSGHTCPAADICLAKVYEKNGTRVLVPGDNAQFTCYAAKAERQYKNTFALRQRNWQNLVGKSANDVADMLQSALPKTAKIVRVHSSGDFFSKSYFQGWLKFAENNPNLTIFGYSKMLDYVRIVRDSALDNMFFAYSFGGLMDNRVNVHDVVSYVVTPEWTINGNEATAPDGTVVPLACTADKSTAHLDYVAILNRESFGLTLH